MNRIFVSGIIALSCLASNLNINAEAYDISMANAKVTLDFLNYLGNNENIHPKVLYFPEGWRGFKFWMGYTPYPKGDINAENPCIAVSQDGFYWDKPEGLVNPLALAPENGYNSDTHLVYDKENDRLEVWYRPFDRTVNHDAVVRRVSEDGISWSDSEIMIDYNEFGEMVLSPAVWKEGGVYTMVYSNCKVLKYSRLDTSIDGSGWSEPVIIPIEWGSLSAWHQDVIQDEDGTLQMVVCAFEYGANNNQADLYYVEVESDFLSASEPVCILKRGEALTDFDHRSIYRASLVRLENSYRLYYSAIDEYWSRYMAVSEGDSPLTLKGVADVYTPPLVERKITVNGRSVSIASGRAAVYDTLGRHIANVGTTPVTIPSGIYVVFGEGINSKIIIK